MESIISAKEFLTALTKVSKTLPKKSSLQALENVKLDFTEDKCTLTGSDLEQYIVINIPAQGDNFSFIFLDTKAILKACKYFKNELKIIYDSSENTVTLKSNKKTCKQCVFQIIEDSYPSIPEIIADDIYTTISTTLLDRYNKIKYAISKDESKMLLTGIHFKDNEIITCDGFRMAISKDNNLNVNKPFTVPQKAMNLLSIYDKNTEVEIKVNDKYLMFISNDITLITRLFDGNYYDVDSFIPKESTENYEVNIKPYLDSLNYLKNFVSDNKNCRVIFENGNLIGKNNEGQYSSELDFGEGSEIKYGFNCNYMIDALNQFKDSDKIDYKLVSSIAPIVMTSESDLALLLPVRVS